MLSRDDLERALKKKGFVSDTKKHDYRYYRYFRNGKRTPITTKVSHGSSYKDISNSLVGAVANQMQLSIPQLRDFVECRLTAEMYADLVADKT